MIVAIVIVALVVVLFFIWISINNDIVQKNNKCDAAWQTIDATSFPTWWRPSRAMPPTSPGRLRP